MTPATLLRWSCVAYFIFYIEKLTGKNPVYMNVWSNMLNFLDPEAPLRLMVLGSLQTLMSVSLDIKLTFWHRNGESSHAFQLTYNQSQLQWFLGIVSFNCNFISHCELISKPLKVLIISGHGMRLFSLNCWAKNTRLSRRPFYSWGQFTKTLMDHFRQLVKLSPSHSNFLRHDIWSSVALKQIHYLLITSVARFQWLRLFYGSKFGLPTCVRTDIWIVCMLLGCI